MATVNQDSVWTKGEINMCDVGAGAGGRAGAALLTTPGSKPAHWHTDMYAMFDDVQISNL